MANPIDLIEQNWIITPTVNLPATRLVTTGLRPTSGNQLWLLVLSGLAGVDVAGKGNLVEWVSETLTILPDVQAPLTFALDSLVSNPAGTTLAFDLEMWAPFVTISGSTDQAQYTVDAGFSLKYWRPTPFIPTLVDLDGNPAKQVFQGVDVEVAALNTSEVARLSYNITLVGRIVRLGQAAGSLGQGRL